MRRVIFSHLVSLTAGLLLVLGSAAPAAAQTVLELHKAADLQTSANARPEFASGAPSSRVGHQTRAVVRAVMFWMEGCPHCHYVLDEVLPPLQEKYGQQLEIRLVELASAADVDLLYRTAARPDGFALAIGMLVVMAAALIYAVAAFIRGEGIRLGSQIATWQTYAVPFLVLLGLFVAGYLAYVEIEAVAAACGPVGDCNTVQSSPYARLFGVLPIGVLGLAGYILIMLAWVFQQRGNGSLKKLASLGPFGMAFFGTLFSLYLTYLEPFVIQAVCMWCLTSAAIITLLLVLSAGPAVQDFNALEEAG